MRELMCNIVWLPATCDVLGMNYIIALLVVLGLSIINRKLSPEFDSIN